MDNDSLVIIIIGILLGFIGGIALAEYLKYLKQK